ncbi:MAG: hypothetical protein M3521_15385 [Acidobacteriota bacterium]|nr:hypothetical protein [Acidobacteriota bacterium]
MATAKTNENENGAKPQWKRLKEKKEFTEAEMARIKASRAVMKVIEKQIERGDFDEYLDKEHSKV